MIHILTLSWNGLDKLQRLRPGLMRNLDKLNTPYTWHIRDNGSKDETVSEVSCWENTKVYSIPHNRDNFAQGINYLVNQTPHEPTDVFLLLNNDVEFVDDDSLGCMLRLMTPLVGIVGARLLYHGTNKIQHCGVIFGKRYALMPYHFRHKESADESTRVNRYFQAVTAAVMMVRAEFWDAIGGLDEGFRWSFEDIDLNLRIGELGKKIICCGETNIYHEESASLRKNPVNKMFLTQNVKLFRDKWFGKYQIDHELYLADPHYNEV